MINPETAQIEDTISIGNWTSRLAVSQDGQYLYVSLLKATFPYDSLGTIDRYRIQDHSLDLQIALGQYTGGNILRDAQAMVALPGQPSSVLIATTDHRLTVFDGSVPRTGTAALNVSSLYVRPSDGAIFGVGDRQLGFGNPQMFWFSVSANGVSLLRSVPVDPNWEGAVTWNGNLATNTNTFATNVFDLNAGVTLGRVPLPQPTGSSGACVLSTDAAGTSAIVYQYVFRGQGSSTTLVQYSLANFRQTASAEVTGLEPDSLSISNLCSPAWTWGVDGILIRGYSGLLFLHTSGLNPLNPSPIPTPTQDASGVIHLALPANGLAYDSGRNLLWASVPGTAAAAGNSVVSIDPSTGNVIDTIYAGSEPGVLALSGDGSHLFATLGGAPAVALIDLSAKQSSSFSVLDADGSLYWLPVGVASIAAQGNSAIAVRTASGGANSSVVAYDAGVPRKNRFDSGTGANLFSQYVQTIFPGDTPNAFYAADVAQHYGDGSHEVYRLTVDSTGVQLDLPLRSAPGTTLLRSRRMAKL
jgi:hypothetical protein